MKKIVLIHTIPKFKEVELDKDIGMLPLYLCKEYGMKGEIIYYKDIVNNNIMSKNGDVGLFGIEKARTNYPFAKKMFRTLNNIYSPMRKYLKINASNIDYLMLVHLDPFKYYLIKEFKKRNPKGLIYLKLDINNDWIDYINRMGKCKSIKYKIVNYLQKAVLKNSDLISCETKNCYDELSKGLLDVKLSNKLTLLPNGISDRFVKESNINVKSFSEKENIFITVGRIGSDQKNSKMILDALKTIELNDWKFYFIGPIENIENNFQDKIDELYLNFPEKKDNIFFIGNVEKKSELYKYYNRAKCFVLSSVYEGFPLVFTEAAYFGNYIITTDVGGSADITDNGNLGSIIEINNTLQLATTMDKVIRGIIKLDDYYQNIIVHSRKQYLWENIVKNEKLEEFFK